MGATAVAEDRVALGPELARLESFASVVEFCERLRQDAQLEVAMRESVKRKLDARQAAFDRSLAHHPASVAEKGRRRYARKLESERSRYIAARESHRIWVGLQRLARRWNAALVMQGEMQ